MLKKIYVKFRKSKNKKYIIIFSIILLFSIIFLNLRKDTNNIQNFQNLNNIDESKYFTTWATALQRARPPPFEFEGNSFRQIVRISASGEKLRIKLSNIFGNRNLEIKGVSVANIISNSEIDNNSMKILTFNGKESIIIEKRREIYSDTIIYPLKSLSYLAISIYFGSVPESLSGHHISFTYSYFEKGNTIKSKIFSEKNKIPRWYFISAIEVFSNIPKKVIVCFGDSITDGMSNTDDARFNYPNILLSKLHENKDTSEIAIINEGIVGDEITTDGINRFEHDVLNIKGIKYIILLFGINDIFRWKNSDEIISVYRKIIEKAHKRNIFIYGGTLIPCTHLKMRHYLEREKERQKVNKWIRETSPKNGGFDDYFDFDKALKDPNDEIKIKDEYDCGDGIHPNLEGYKKMVECINDLKLFTKR